MFDGMGVLDWVVLVAATIALILLATRLFAET
jgi:hypothetical protein